MTLAKLCRPSVARVVPRAWLFRVLDRTAERAVTWIWAPPGAGKTTLAASYVAARTLRGFWYSLDSGDADLASFFVLRCTTSESRALLRRIRGRSATPTQLQWLQTRTEGGVAGLVLLADADPVAAEDSGPGVSLRLVSVHGEGVRDVTALFGGAGGSGAGGTAPDRRSRTSSANPLLRFETVFLIHGSGARVRLDRSRRSPSANDSM